MNPHFGARSVCLVSLLLLLAAAADPETCGQGLQNDEMPLLQILRHTQEFVNSVGPQVPQQLENITGVPSECNYRNHRTPCFYFQSDRLLDPAGRAVPHKWRVSLVQELELPLIQGEKTQNLSLPGSLHEFAQGVELDVFYLTRQAPASVLTRAQRKKVDKDAVFLTNDNLELESAYLGDMVGSNAVHQKLRSRKLKSSDLTQGGLHAMRVRADTGSAIKFAYLTLQFLDAIAVLDLASFKIVEIYFIPCQKLGLEMAQDMDASAYGMDVMDCAAPHTLTLDKKGNIYITFKGAGSIGVLQNPANCVNLDGCWRSFPIAAGAKPFYIDIATDDTTGHQYIYFNDVADSHVGVFDVTHGHFPPAPPRIINLLKHGFNFNPRAGGLVGLWNGAALFTAYSEKGLLMYVDPAGDVEPVFLANPSGMQDPLAYLHICATHSADLSKQDITVLSSSNDFPFMETEQSPYNPDGMRQIRDIDLPKIVSAKCSSARSYRECEQRTESSPFCRWMTELGQCHTFIPEKNVETFAASTQNSWWHRVFCVQPLQGHTRLVGNKTFHYGQTILATSLLADRLVSKQTVVVDDREVEVPGVDEYLNSTTRWM